MRHGSRTSQRGLRDLVPRFGHIGTILKEGSVHPPVQGKKQEAAQKMPKKKETKDPVCGECMKPIDDAAVIVAIANREEYRHECGRILVHAR